MLPFNAYGDAFFGRDDEPEILLPDVVQTDVCYRVTFPRALFHGRRFSRLTVRTTYTEIVAGSAGYMFYPAMLQHGCALSRFTERKGDAMSLSTVNAFGFAGIGGCDNAVMIWIRGGRADSRFRAEVRFGGTVYYLAPEFMLDGEEPDEDIVVEYRMMPGATYADMARVYREWNLREGGCRSLRERAKENPYLAYAADAMEFRVRMGWKPVPTPVLRQTSENEPPVKVVCDVRTLRRLVRRMKEKGVARAEICLVGWSIGGHDGRFPQLVPAEPAFGSDAEMREAIAEAQAEGYQVVCHTGSMESYEVADNFDLDAMTFVKAPDGKRVPYLNGGYVRSGGLSGGAPYIVCARTAYEKYAVNELPKVRDYGFRGLHFIDELTAVPAFRCAHEAHPVSRKTASEYYRKIARLASDLFGGFQSESWLDFMNAETDYIMYASFLTRLDENVNPLYDEMIPLWQLAWHGIVLSNPSSTTVNHVLKDREVHLRFLEYGGRPLMYLYSKFGERKNWMGDVDLHAGNDGEIDATADALKAAYDEYEALRYLQYEFMENHEKLGDGVYRVTYSDGTRMTVDYSAGTCSVEKDGTRRVITV